MVTVFASSGSTSRTPQTIETSGYSCFTLLAPSTADRPVLDLAPYAFAFSPLFNHALPKSIAGCSISRYVPSDSPNVATT